MKHYKNKAKRLLIATIILGFIGCETGIHNKNEHKGEFGEIDHNPSATGTINTTTSTKSYNKTSNTKHIYSKSAVPGYYLQIDVFKTYEPGKSYLAKLDNSPFNYNILQKYDTLYALIGPYKSYNQANAQKHAVKSKLSKDSFVVQVLRP